MQPLFQRNMSKKERFEDDGRTIADMSGVERPPLILPNIKRFKELRAERKAAQENNPEVFSSSEEGQYRKRYESSEDKETRKAYLGGAISATLLIALIYLGAFALLVVILLLIWGVL